MQHAETIADALSKAAPAPPIAVLAANLSGVTLPDVVNLLTIVYVSVLLAHKLWRISGEWKARRQRKLKRRATDESKP